ncbi:hypothetical protein K502DRAFT_326149 [Neoconidiobolus thromboides FSU 785]|nr:hypothetical protein K502DRAFT_326149 [Neoconidiobolus thromboides FSU 785]
MRLLILCFLFLISVTFGEENYIYTSSIDLKEVESILKREGIDGAEVLYSWKSLEGNKGCYNFTKINSDLSYLKKLNRKLYIQLQDRFFLPKAKNIPSYLLTDPIYQSGLEKQVFSEGSGWVAKQWVKEVRDRYQALIYKLAKEFDGKIEGIILPETSIEVEESKLNCADYFDAELANIKYTKSQFKQSKVIQFVNFWPCEWKNSKNFMSTFFENALEHGFGLGGPDVIPYNKPQMNNSYPFFNEYKIKHKLSWVAMAVQEPDLVAINPKTNTPFTRQEFKQFAVDYLGADSIFWTKELLI